MSVTSIRLQDDLDKLLSDLALKSNRSKNWLINQAIKEFVENQALEEQRWLDTLPALDSVRSGRSVPAEQVDAWLATWGKEQEGDAPIK
jgi:predicted transcriptional regulator